MFHYITIDIDPIIVSLGPIALRWYGLMYVLGTVAGMWVALPDAERRGISREKVWDMFPWIAISALIGGRLYFVVQNNLWFYLHYPKHILATWEGGMAFYGAIFLGVPVAAILCWRSGVPFLRFLDSAAVFTPLAQTFGRIGNVINGDVVGYTTTLPWGVRYVHPRSMVTDHFAVHQPAAAYELLLSAALFAAIYFSLRQRLKANGMLFVAWFFLYSLGQLIIFFWRDNAIVAFGLKQAQFTAIAVMILCIPLAILLQRRASSPGPRAVERPALAMQPGDRPSA